MMDFRNRKHNEKNAHGNRAVPPGPTGHFWNIGELLAFSVHIGLSCASSHPVSVPLNPLYTEVRLCPALFSRDDETPALA